MLPLPWLLRSGANFGHGDVLEGARQPQGGGRRPPQTCGELYLGSVAMGTGWGGGCPAPETPASPFPWAFNLPPFPEGGLPTPALGCCRLLCGLALGPFLGLAPLFDPATPAGRSLPLSLGRGRGGRGLAEFEEACKEGVPPPTRAKRPEPIFMHHHGVGVGGQRPDTAAPKAAPKARAT